MSILFSLNNSSTFRPFNATHDDWYTQQLSDQMAVTLLPAIVFLAVSMIVGCFGNSMVFYVYLTKFNPSSTRTAIIALATFDLVACCVCMPGEILDIRYSYNFDEKALCKMLRLLTTVCLSASGLTLLVVAVDRYRRICHPLKQQLSARQTKRWVALCAIMAVVFAIPSFVVYGVSKIPTPREDVYGTSCSIDQAYSEHVLPLINNILQALLFGAVFAAMIVLYMLLGRQVFRQNKFRNSVPVIVPANQEERDISITDGTRNSSQPQSPQRVVNEMSFTNGGSKEECEVDRKRSMPTRKPSVFQNNRKSVTSSDKRTRKTTLMLFSISAVFVISFLPYLILKGFQAVKKDFPNSGSTGDIVSYNVFVRSFFFNSVSNCFIYGFCSPKFRHECKKVIFSIVFCTKQKLQA